MNNNTLTEIEYLGAALDHLNNAPPGSGLRAIAMWFAPIDGTESRDVLRGLVRDGRSMYCKRLAEIEAAA